MKSMKVLKSLLVVGLLCSMNGMVAKAEEDNEKQVETLSTSKETVKVATGNDVETNPIEGGAKIGERIYATLQEALENAVDGDEIVLLKDIHENVNINKKVIIDGNNLYYIEGQTFLQNGILQNLTLKPNTDDQNGRVLTLGSNENVDILMNNVKVLYSSINRSAGSAMTLSGNKASILVKNCLFTNDANNYGEFEAVQEWSYGLYINAQANEGQIRFVDNEFKGAFRTMLPGCSGNMLIENNKFINTVYSVSNGPTSGAGAEATCITTSNEKNNQIVIKNNMIDNAGAFYLQTNVVAESNIFKYDKFEHYIQTNGSIGEAVDFSNNDFIVGNNDLVIIDTAATPVILPVNQEAVNYWVWSDTPADVRPNDYSSYCYMYNADGSRTYMPKTGVAFEQFLHGVEGNLTVENNDIVKVDNDIEVDSINIDKNIEIIISENSVLTLSGDSNVNSNVMVSGNGELLISQDSKLIIEDNSRLEILSNSKNEGIIINSGKLVIENEIVGNEVTGNSPEKHQHDYGELIPEVPATVSKTGMKAHYVCGSCGKYFDINKKETKKEDLLIPKLSNIGSGSYDKASVIAKTEKGNKVKAKEVGTASELKDKLADKKAVVASIEVSKADGEVTVTYKAGKEVQAKTLYVVNLREDGQLMLLDTVKADAKGNVVVKVKPGTTFTLLTKLNGWILDLEGNWYFYEEDGTPADRWLANAVTWFMIEDGKMLTNEWVASSEGRWYYVGNDGSIVYNQWVDGCWINEEGIYYSPTYNK